MTKQTLVEKLSEAINAIEDGTLHPEVELTDSFIESIQEIQCGIEDGEYCGNYGWDEDVLPNNMPDLMVDELATKYIRAGHKVDMYLLVQAIMCAREFIVNLIVYSALYNL